MGFHRRFHRSWMMKWFLKKDDIMRIKKKRLAKFEKQRQILKIKFLQFKKVNNKNFIFKQQFIKKHRYFGKFKNTSPAYAPFPRVAYRSYLNKRHKLLKRKRKLRNIRYFLINVRKKMPLARLEEFISIKKNYYILTFIIKKLFKNI